MALHIIVFSAIGIIALQKLDDLKEVVQLPSYLVSSRHKGGTSGIAV